MVPSANERNDLLAEVAEMYFLREMTQAQIAKQLGVDRSMISRMLTEARRQGIVEFRIHKPQTYDQEVQSQLQEQFDLLEACVITISQPEDNTILEDLGKASSRLITKWFRPGLILGLSWGTSVSATVDALEVDQIIPIKVVQLAGALGARAHAYDGQSLVQQLARKLGGESFLLNAPFIVDSLETARALRANRNIRETLTLAEQCDVVLTGIGSTEPEYVSVYQAGNIPDEDINLLRAAKVVGDTCGLFFDVHGKPCGLELQKRLMAIQRQTLLSIPIRIGVAAGIGKALAILGAIRAGYINILVTDNWTAKELISLNQEKGKNQ